MTYDDLYLWYITEEMSLRQVAKRAGLSAGTVRYHMKRLGIPRRTKSEALSGSKNPMHGKMHTEDSKRKIVETLQKTNLDPEVHARRVVASSGERNPMYGRNHTEESKKAMSTTRLSSVTPESRRQQSIRMRAYFAAVPEARKVISDHAKTRMGILNSFFGKTHSEGTKQRLAQANQGRFRGSKGSNWRGGRVKLQLQIRGGSKMQLWRKSIFERDSYTCVLCGTRGGQLNADHIKPFAVILAESGALTLEDAESFDGLWDLSNGRTLCVTCHRNTDTFAGRTKAV